MIRKRKVFYRKKFPSEPKLLKSQLSVYPWTSTLISSQPNKEWSPNSQEFGNLRIPMWNNIASFQHCLMGCLPPASLPGHFPTAVLKTADLCMLFNPKTCTVLISSLLWGEIQMSSQISNPPSYLPSKTKAGEIKAENLRQEPARELNGYYPEHRRFLMGRVVPGQGQANWSNHPRPRTLGGGGPAELEGAATAPPAGPA